MLLTPKGQSHRDLLPDQHNLAITSDTGNLVKTEETMRKFTDSWKSNLLQQKKPNENGIQCYDPRLNRDIVKHMGKEYSKHIKVEADSKPVIGSPTAQQGGAGNDILLPALSGRNLAGGDDVFKYPDPRKGFHGMRRDDRSGILTPPALIDAHMQGYTEYMEQGSPKPPSPSLLSQKLRKFKIGLSPQQKIRNLLDDIRMDEKEWKMLDKGEIADYAMLATKINNTTADNANDAAAGLKKNKQTGALGLGAAAASGQPGPGQFQDNLSFWDESSGGSEQQQQQQQQQHYKRTLSDPAFEEVQTLFPHLGRTQLGQLSNDDFLYLQQAMREQGIVNGGGGGGGGGGEMMLGTDAAAAAAVSPSSFFPTQQQQPSTTFDDSVALSKGKTITSASYATAATVEIPRITNTNTTDYDDDDNDNFIYEDTSPESDIPNPNPAGVITGANRISNSNSDSNNNNTSSSSSRVLGTGLMMGGGLDERSSQGDGDGQLSRSRPEYEYSATSSYERSFANFPNPAGAGSTVIPVRKQDANVRQHTNTGGGDTTRTGAATEVMTEKNQGGHHHHQYQQQQPSGGKKEQSSSDLDRELGLFSPVNSSKRGQNKMPAFRWTEVEAKQIKERIRPAKPPRCYNCTKDGMLWCDHCRRVTCYNCWGQEDHHDPLEASIAFAADQGRLEKANAMRGLLEVERRRMKAEQLINRLATPGPEYSLMSGHNTALRKQRVDPADVEKVTYTPGTSTATTTPFSDVFTTTKANREGGGGRNKHSNIDTDKRNSSSGDRKKRESTPSAANDGDGGGELEEMNDSQILPEPINSLSSSQTGMNDLFLAGVSVVSHATDQSSTNLGHNTTRITVEARVPSGVLHNTGEFNNGTTPTDIQLKADNGNDNSNNNNNDGDIADDYENNEPASSTSREVGEKSLELSLEGGGEEYDRDMEAFLDDATAASEYSKHLDRPPTAMTDNTDDFDQKSNISGGLDYSMLAESERSHLDKPMLSAINADAFYYQNAMSPTVQPGSGCVQRSLNDKYIEYDEMNAIHFSPAKKDPERVNFLSGVYKDRIHITSERTRGYGEMQRGREERAMNVTHKIKRQVHNVLADKKKLLSTLASRRSNGQQLTISLASGDNNPVIKIGKMSGGRPLLHTPHSANPAELAAHTFSISPLNKKLIVPGVNADGTANRRPPDPRELFLKRKAKKERIDKKKREEEERRQMSRWVLDGREGGGGYHYPPNGGAASASAAGGEGEVISEYGDDDDEEVSSTAYGNDTQNERISTGGAAAAPMTMARDYYHRRVDDVTSTGRSNDASSSSSSSSTHTTTDPSASGQEQGLSTLLTAPPARWGWHQMRARSAKHGNFPSLPFRGPPYYVDLKTEVLEEAHLNTAHRLYSPTHTTMEKISASLW